MAKATTTSPFSCSRLFKLDTAKTQPLAKGRWLPRAQIPPMFALPQGFAATFIRQKYPCSFAA
jgi:hypothetical protein